MSQHTLLEDINNVVTDDNLLRKRRKIEDNPLWKALNGVLTEDGKLRIGERGIEIPTRQPLDPESLSPFEKVKKNWYSGWGSTKVSFGLGLEWVGLEQESEAIADYGTELKEKGMKQLMEHHYDKEEKDFEFSDLLTSTWWFEKAPGMLPAMISLMVPGFIGYAVGGAIGGAATAKAIAPFTAAGLILEPGPITEIISGALITVGSAIGALTAGSGISRTLEGIMLAGTTSGELIDQYISEGLTREEAALKASVPTAQVYRKSYNLVGLDAVQLGIALTPMKFIGTALKAGKFSAKQLDKLTKAIKSPATFKEGLAKTIIESQNFMNKIRKAVPPGVSIPIAITASMATEAFEEGYQEWISHQAINTARGLPVDSWDEFIKRPEVQEAMVLGAVGSLILLGAGRTVVLTGKASGKAMKTINDKGNESLKKGKKIIDYMNKVNSATSDEELNKIRNEFTEKTIEQYFIDGKESIIEKKLQDEISSGNINEDDIELYKSMIERMKDVSKSMPENSTSKAKKKLFRLTNSLTQTDNQLNIIKSKVKTSPLDKANIEVFEETANDLLIQIKKTIKDKRTRPDRNIFFIDKAHIQKGDTVQWLDESKNEQLSQPMEVTGIGVHPKRGKLVFTKEERGGIETKDLKIEVKAQDRIITIGSQVELIETPKGKLFKTSGIVTEIEEDSEGKQVFRIGKTNVRVTGEELKLIPRKKETKSFDELLVNIGKLENIIEENFDDVDVRLSDMTDGDMSQIGYENKIHALNSVRQRITGTNTYLTPTGKVLSSKSIEEQGVQVANDLFEQVSIEEVLLAAEKSVNEKKSFLEKTLKEKKEEKKGEVIAPFTAPVPPTEFEKLSLEKNERIKAQGDSMKYQIVSDDSKDETSDDSTEGENEEKKEFNEKNKASELTDQNMNEEEPDDINEIRFNIENKFTLFKKQYESLFRNIPGVPAQKAIIILLRLSKITNFKDTGKPFIANPLKNLKTLVEGESPDPDIVTMYEYWRNEIRDENIKENKIVQMFNGFANTEIETIIESRSQKGKPFNLGMANGSLESNMYDTMQYTLRKLENQVKENRNIMIKDILDKHKVKRDKLKNIWILNKSKTNKINILQEDLDVMFLLTGLHWDDFLDNASYRKEAPGYNTYQEFYVSNDHKFGSSNPISQFLIESLTTVKIGADKKPKGIIKQLEQKEKNKELDEFGNLFELSYRKAVILAVMKVTTDFETGTKRTNLGTLSFNKALNGSFIQRRQNFRDVNAKNLTALFMNSAWKKQLNDILNKTSDFYKSLRYVKFYRSKGAKPKYVRLSGIIRTGTTGAISKAEHGTQSVEDTRLLNFLAFFYPRRFVDEGEYLHWVNQIADKKQVSYISAPKYEIEKAKTIYNEMRLNSKYKHLIAPMPVFEAGIKNLERSLEKFIRKGYLIANEREVFGKIRKVLDINGMNLNDSAELFAYNYAINNIEIREYFQGRLNLWENYSELTNRYNGFHSTGPTPNIFIEGGIGETRKTLVINDPEYTHLFRDFKILHQDGDGSSLFSDDYSNKFFISTGELNHTILKYIHAEVMDDGQAFYDKSNGYNIKYLAEVKTEGVNVFKELQEFMKDNGIDEVSFKSSVKKELKDKTVEIFDIKNGKVVLKENWKEQIKADNVIELKNNKIIIQQNLLSPVKYSKRKLAVQFLRNTLNFKSGNRIAELIKELVFKNRSELSNALSSENNLRKFMLKNLNPERDSYIIHLLENNFSFSFPHISVDLAQRLNSIIQNKILDIPTNRGIAVTVPSISFNLNDVDIVEGKLKEGEIALSKDWGLEVGDIIFIDRIPNSTLSSSHIVKVKYLLSGKAQNAIAVSERSKVFDNSDQDGDTYHMRKAFIDENGDTIKYTKGVDNSSEAISNEMHRLWLEEYSNPKNFSEISRPIDEKAWDDIIEKLPDPGTGLYIDVVQSAEEMMRRSISSNKLVGPMDNMVTTLSYMLAHDVKVTEPVIFPIFKIEDGKTIFKGNKKLSKLSKQGIFDLGNLLTLALADIKKPKMERIGMRFGVSPIYLMLIALADKSNVSVDKESLGIFFNLPLVKELSEKLEESRGVINSKQQNQVFREWAHEINASIAVKYFEYPLKIAKSSEERSKVRKNIKKVTELNASDLAVQSDEAKIRMLKYIEDLFLMNSEFFDVSNYVGSNKEIPNTFNARYSTVIKSRKVIKGKGKLDTRKFSRSSHMIRADQALELQSTFYSNFSVLGTKLSKRVINLFEWANVPAGSNVKADLTEAQIDKLSTALPDYFLEEAIVEKREVRNLFQTAINSWNRWFALSDKEKKDSPLTPLYSILRVESDTKDNVSGLNEKLKIREEFKEEGRLSENEILNIRKSVSNFDEDTKKMLVNYNALQYGYSLWFGNGAFSLFFDLNTQKELSDKMEEVRTKFNREDLTDGEVNMVFEALKTAHPELTLEGRKNPGKTTGKRFYTPHINRKELETQTSPERIYIIEIEKQQVNVIVQAEKIKKINEIMGKYGLRAGMNEESIISIVNSFGGRIIKGFGKFQEVRKVEKITPKFQIAEEGEAEITEETAKKLLDRLSARFGIEVVYLSKEEGKDLEWAGGYKDGKVTINLAKVKADTPFHEIAHPFIEVIKKDNLELYNKLSEEVQKQPEIMEEIKRVRTDLKTKEEQIEEAIVLSIGKFAAGKINPETGNELIKVIKEFLRKISDMLRDLLKVDTQVIPEDLDPNMTLDDIAAIIALGVGEVQLVNPIEAATGLTPEVVTEKVKEFTDRKSRDFNDFMVNHEGFTRQDKSFDELPDSAKQQFQDEYKTYLKDFKDAQDMLKVQDFRKLSEEKLINLERIISFYDDLQSEEVFMATSFYIAETLRLKQYKFAQDEGNPKMLAQLMQRPEKRKDIAFSIGQSLTRIDTQWPDIQAFNRMLLAELVEADKERFDGAEKIDTLLRKLKLEKYGSKLMVLLKDVSPFAKDDLFENMMDIKGQLFKKGTIGYNKMTEAEKEYINEIQRQQVKYGQKTTPQVGLNFMETLKLKGFFSAWLVYISKERGQDDIVLTFTNPNTGLKEKKRFAEAKEILKNYANRNKGTLKYIDALRRVTELNIKALKLMDDGENQDGSSVQITNDSEVYMDKNMKLINRFSLPLPTGTPVSKNLHKAYKLWLSNAIGNKRLNPLVPKFTALETLYKHAGELKNLNETLMLFKRKYFTKKDVASIFGRKVDFFLDLFSIWTYMIVMPFNLKAAIVNLSLGKFNTFREQPIINALRGEIRYWGGMFSGKTINIMRKKHILNFQEDINPGNYVGRYFAMMAFGFTRMAEHMIQGAAFFGQMTQEEWDNIKKDGNFKDPNKRIDKARENLMIRRGERIQGRYNSIDKRLFSMFAWGRAIMLFRTWAPEVIENRIGRNYINIYGEELEGSFRTMRKHGIEDGKAVLRALAGKDFQEVRRLWNSDELHWVNNRKNIKGLLMIAAMMLLFLMTGDDKDKEFGKYLSRTISDMMLFFSPENVKFAVQSPVPGLQVVFNLYDAVDAAFSLKEYKVSTEFGKKGEYMYPSRFFKVMPYNKLPKFLFKKSKTEE